MASDILYSDVQISFGETRTVSRIKHLYPKQVQFALNKDDRSYFTVEEAIEDVIILDKHDGTNCPNKFEIHYIKCLGCVDMDDREGTYVDLPSHIDPPEYVGGISHKDLENLRRLAKNRRKKMRQLRNELWNDTKKGRHVRFAPEA